VDHPSTADSAAPDVSAVVLFLFIRLVTFANSRLDHAPRSVIGSKLAISRRHALPQRKHQVDHALVVAGGDEVERLLVPRSGFGERSQRRAASSRRIRRSSSTTGLSSRSRSSDWRGGSAFAVCHRQTLPDSSY